MRDPAGSGQIAAVSEKTQVGKQLEAHSSERNKDIS